MSDCINPQRSLSLLRTVYSHDYHLRPLDLSSFQQIPDTNETQAVSVFENVSENKDEQRSKIITTDTQDSILGNYDSISPRADVVSIQEELSSLQTAKIFTDQSQTSKEHSTLVHIFQENVIADIVAHAPPEVLPNTEGSRFTSATSYASAVQAHATKSEQRSSILRAFQSEVTKGEVKERKRQEKEKQKRENESRGRDNRAKTPLFLSLEKENEQVCEKETKIAVPLELLSSVDRLALGLRLGDPRPLPFNPQLQLSTTSFSTPTQTTASSVGGSNISSSPTSTTQVGTTMPFSPSSMPYHTSFFPMFDLYESSWRQYVGKHQSQLKKEKKFREKTETTETAEVKGKKGVDNEGNAKFQQHQQDQQHKQD